MWRWADAEVAGPPASRRTMASSSPATSAAASPAVITARVITPSVSMRASWCLPGPLLGVVPGPRVAGHAVPVHPGVGVDEHRDAVDLGAVGLGADELPRPDDLDLGGRAAVRPGRALDPAVVATGAGDDQMHAGSLGPVVVVQEHVL